MDGTSSISIDSGLAEKAHKSCKCGHEIGQVRTSDSAKQNGSHVTDFERASVTPVILKMQDVTF